MATMANRLAAFREAMAAGDGIVLRTVARERPSTVPGHVSRHEADEQVTDACLVRRVREAAADSDLLYHDGQLGVRLDGVLYRIQLSRPGYESAAYRRTIGVE